MEFLFRIPPDIIINEMCTTFYPFLYVFTGASSQEANSYYIKGCIFALVASIRSCMEVAEYFTSKIHRNFDQINNSIVSKDRFV